MTALFTAALLFIFYTYFGYPILLIIIGFFSRRHRCPAPDPLPRISLVIPVYNEEEVIGRKLENSLNLQYPRDKLTIIVASDGSCDQTVPIARKYVDRGIRLIDYPRHRGKMSVINRVCSRIEGDVIVFTDASAIFRPDALTKLIEPFGDDSVGAVSGALILREEKDQSKEHQIDLYWRMEKFIRQREGEVYSCISATGAIYAIRREIFRPWPEDTILDDLLIPLEAVRRGLRIVFTPAASAREETSTDISLEFKRKVRTLAGNYQAFGRARWAFCPWKSPVWAVLISHKLFRLLVPFALLALLLSAALGGAALRPFLFFQLILYFFALLGWFCLRTGRHPLKLFSLCLTFLILNAAAFRAFMIYFFRRKSLSWK